MSAQPGTRIGTDGEGRALIRTVHTATAEAPVETLYALLAHARLWPAVFQPTVFVELLEVPGAETARTSPGALVERFRIWASVNGKVVSWSSRRELDEARRVIAFRQEHSTPPIASMSGTWRIEPAGGGLSRVELVHEFSTIDSSPESHGWIAQALERNSTAELGQLCRLAELDARFAAGGGLLTEFEDSFEVDAPPEAVYAFIEHGELWEKVLPHVERSVLTVEQDGAQRLELTTRTPDGGRHQTSSTRLCIAPDRIAYKQNLTPRILLGHAGLWTVAPAPGGRTRATSRHTFTLDPEALEQVLGAGTTVEAARAHLRESLGANSRATLEHAGAPGS
jgi:aromatase